MLKYVNVSNETLDRVTDWTKVQSKIKSSHRWKIKQELSGQKHSLHFCPCLDLQGFRRRVWWGQTMTSLHCNEPLIQQKTTSWCHLSWWADNQQILISGLSLLCSNITVYSSTSAVTSLTLSSIQTFQKLFVHSEAARCRRAGLWESIRRSESESVWRRPQRRTTQAERRLKSREEECQTSDSWWKIRPVRWRRVVRVSRTDGLGLVFWLKCCCSLTDVVFIPSSLGLKTREAALCCTFEADVRLQTGWHLKLSGSGEYSGGWKRTFLEITNWRGVRAEGAAVALWVTRVYLDWVCRPSHTNRACWHGGCRAVLHRYTVTFTLLAE